MTEQGISWGRYEQHIESQELPMWRRRAQGTSTPFLRERAASMAAEASAKQEANVAQQTESAWGAAQNKAAKQAK